jgi:hypothetical protein
MLHLKIKQQVALTDMLLSCQDLLTREKCLVRRKSTPFKGCLKPPFIGILGPHRAKFSLLAGGNDASGIMFLDGPTGYHLIIRKEDYEISYDRSEKLSGP